MAASFHARTADDTLAALGGTAKGLSSGDAELRLSRYGPNEIKEAEAVSPLALFLKQFNSIVIWILIAATLISAFLREYIDAVVIGVILVLIGVLGFIQEYKAERAIEALKRMSPPHATAIRDGQRMRIDAKELVPGDIILIEPGDKVPADARLITVANLRVQEAALTGESQAVSKAMRPVAGDAPLAERSCCAYSGTAVASGKGTAVVFATGMQTEIGKIAALLQQTKPEPTPLQLKMDQLGRWMGGAVIAITLIVFSVGMIMHQAPFLEMLIASVSLAVAAIPEGLPAVVTISLALGTQRMLKRNALVRHLPSVETLGSTTVICTDKTGTLTRNEMTVRKIYANEKTMDVTGSGYSPRGQFLFRGRPVPLQDIEMLLTIGAVNNDAEMNGNGIAGDPTEGALLVAAAKAGFSPKGINARLPRVDEIEFTSERKLMTTLHDRHGETLAFVKGAPEIVLGLCSSILDNGDVRKMEDEDRQAILRANHALADDALRVLGFAYRVVMRNTPPDRIEQKLVFVGMQGMIDPPRDEARVAVAKCAKAGIKVVMITGDQEMTAKAVARDIGIAGTSMTGAELDRAERLEDVVEDIGIFARVNPEHKLKIVDALKKRGHVVAMTGDGANDAPALKKADIGVAMGITGTDVSKEAASIVLTDDNFASIVNAVEEGRGTYGNIRKYFSYLVSCNIGEVLVIFFGILLGLPLPLTATQILLINLITDGLPALALSVDPFEPHAMDRKPRHRSEPIYKGMWMFLILYPLILTVSALSVFSYFYFADGSILKAQTATFVLISLSELYRAFTCRSTIYPLWKVGIFRNGFLTLAVIGSFITIAAFVFIPPLGSFLDIAPLGVMEFAALALLSSVGGIAIEAGKLIERRRAGA